MPALREGERAEPTDPKEESKKISDCLKTDSIPLIPIFQRRSNSIFEEAEGEDHSHSRKISRTKFSIFRRLSSSSSRDEGQEPNSGDSSPPKLNTERKFSSRFITINRRTSLLLEPDDFNERENSRQLMRCEKMDPCCYTETSNRPQRNCALIPCLIALGAIIIITIPLAKILGGIRSDISVIHHEVTDLKKHVGGNNEHQTGLVEGPDQTAVSKLPEEYCAAIKCLVKEELGNFDSDKTGMTDFALESAGGRIVKTINTENYGSSFGFLGLTLCEGSNGPRAMIQATSAPGECWAFKGSKGAALIKLLGRVQISAVSLEHISTKISPTGKLDTAPREFIVYGLKDPKQTKVLLGNFEYKMNSDPIQMFPVKNNKEPFEYVELHIESNHGSKEFTCVYRFRVHGTLESL